MRRATVLLAAVVAVIGCSSSSSEPLDAASAVDGPRGTAAELSFFVTSRGLDGGNLGGLAGADAHCAALAAAVGAGGRTFRAYLSQSARGADPAVNARDRIGRGPWRNANGVIVARDVDELHGANNLDGTTALTERGDPVPGRGMSPNQHDMLTGSTADGMAYAATPDRTCQSWTSNSAGAARVGHHDRAGGGEAPTSWVSAHDSAGCSPAALVSTGGNGYFYCFAAD